MRKFLLLFLIGYCSYAQVNFGVYYKNGPRGDSTALTVKPGEPIKVVYYDFPSYHDSWLWFIIMPKQNSYTSLNLASGGGRIAFSEYVYGSGKWPTGGIPWEGTFQLLLVDGDIYLHGFSHLWTLCTITVKKKSLLLEDLTEPQQFVTVFPNPTDGLFKIETAEDLLEIQIHDQLGRCVLKTASDSVDLTAQPNGIYLATIQDKNGTVSKRKIIKK